MSAESHNPSVLQLLRGLLRNYPFVLKNFKHYFQNLYRRSVRRTNVVAPYAAVFYATHKCNLDCSYCTQKEPDVFSDELPTRETLDLLRIIRRETDSILFTGGEPLLRADIEQLAAAARRDLKFRSVLLVTNGTLLHKRQGLFDSLHGLIVSLDSLTPLAGEPESKPGNVARVLENLQLARRQMPKPGDVTISSVIEEWNIGEIERILDYCGEQGFVFATQSALNEKMPNLRLLQNPRYRALVTKIIERRRAKTQPINGTPKVLRTVLEFGDFQCFPTMFPRVYPNGDVFYPCEPLKKIGGNLLREGSFRKVFARGRKLYGDIPQCKAICHLFGNVISSYYVKDFWGLAGDTIR
ncbi:MAG TPA: radical SAM protein [Terriglobia bacterium]|jgi:MoaA/NifB/PqqE/SkfB family radical SAM enzyme|nr:radical SAM protein [Terriglobia bacterium]